MIQPIPGKNVDDDKYERTQKDYWEKLHQEFERFKSELGATHSELAQCLGISRQPLVSFMQNSSLGLPIQRSNLERLWDLLTDPERIKEKRLSDGARSKREDLRQKGPDKLLKSAGFLPSGQEILDVNSSRSQQIQRVASRLSSLPVADPADFIRLIESIESFIARSFPSKHKLELNKNQLPYSCMSSEELVERWIKDSNLVHSSNSYVEGKFKRAVSTLAILGKYELESSEMFELYMSISENQRLYREINEFLKMRITQCQFKTLTFWFTEYIIDESLEKELNQSSLEAERQLRFALCDTPDVGARLEDAVSDVVIEASIVCNFRKTNENVCWRYSSSTTHFENMFAAISYGMGCESELELVDLSIRSLGRKDYSLVKTSSIFRDIHTQKSTFNDKLYQGSWVDRSTILGILQSIVFAVRGWLSEKFTTPESCKNYYEVCQAVAAIDESLAKGRKVLNGYRIQNTEYSNGFSVDYFLEKKVIEKVEELKQGILVNNPLLNNLYEASLDYKYCIAKLSCAHSALIEGRIIKAAKLLADVESYLGRIEYKNTPVKILYDSEKMLQLFFTGDSNFFADKNKWRSNLQLSLKELSEYIYMYRKYCGRFDYDTYMIASEIFGRMGRLDFCFCGLEELDYLEKAVQNFLKAAYCSSKIGHRQRAAHWISNASRVCSRLGYGERAKKFSILAENIIDRSLEPAYSSEHREAIMAEVNMAYGERLLLIEKDFDGAMNYFLKSLKGSIYIGSLRFIADNFYNIARASKGLENYQVKKYFEGAFAGKDLKNNQPTWELRANKQGWKENELAAEVIKFINQVERDANWSSVSEQFKEQAKKIWHVWANAGIFGDEVKHPLENEIDSYRYLARVQ